MKSQQWLYSLLALALITQTSSAFAQNDEEEELAQAYGDKSFVTIATGARVPVARAPAVATVITAEDIKAIGATDLDEVLETVPGLHVSRSPLGYAPIYTVRGVRGTLSNPQVLMLVNGISVNIAFDGGRGNTWAGLPIENISRIEVIRGPGSALYGADAFSGVINITTKTAQEINGTQIGLRAASFNTRDAWMLHGGKLGGLDVAGYLRVGSTDGSRRTISADAATPLGAGISHAPGPINTGRDAIDGTLDLSYDKWRLRFGYKQRDNVGSGAGVAQALDPSGQSYSERITSDLTYQDLNFGKDWGVDLQISAMQYKEFSDLVLFPVGANLGGGAFTAGMIGNPYKWEHHGRLNASAFYTGFKQHRVRLGTGFVNEDLYKIRETKNFNPNFTPIGTGSLADVTDVTNTVPFIKPHKRLLRYFYAQDEWNFSNDWTLTAGVRRDNYSDFGATTNPRLALVWEAAYNVTAKLLYGTAFRAPAFNELYAINNPTLIGNSALTPEKMKTLEAAIAWQPTTKVQLGMNLFHYQMSDIIRLVNSTYQNSGKQNGNGLELEAAWDASSNVRLSGNYGYQRSIDEATHQDAGLAPHHRVYLRSDWRFTPGWLANAQANWVAGRKREPSDVRPEISNYTTIDLTLRTQNTRSPWDFAFSMRNLFNADAREPSPLGAPTAIPNDLPLPGRSVLLQLMYKL